MEFTGQQIFDFMSQYGYWVILPLMIIEGPVSTLMAAILASLGAFNVWAVLFFSIIGDVIGDILFYIAGYFWGMPFVNKIGRYMGITENMIVRMEKYFEDHGGKIIFTVKSTTGICWATFVAAGIARMNFWKFFKYSVLGGVVWSGFLVAMGYFYGYMWREIKEYIEWAGWLVMGLALVFLIIMNIYKKYKSKELLK